MNGFRHTPAACGFALAVHTESTKPQTPNQANEVGTMKAMFASKKTWMTLLVLAVLAGAAWWEKDRALAWYQVRELTNSDEARREECAARVAALGQTALPGVLDGLHNGDAHVCANMQAALVSMTRALGCDGRAFASAG